MGGTFGTSARERERKCDRAKGERLRGVITGCGGSDKVIMTSSDRSIFPVDSVAVSRLVVDAAGTESESTDSTGLGGDMNRSDDILFSFWRE
jgi:hypothetical protein